MSKIYINEIPDFDAVFSSENKLHWYKGVDILGIDFVKEKARKRLISLNNVIALDADTDAADEIIVEYVSNYLEIQSANLKRISTNVSFVEFFEMLSFLIIQLYSSYSVTNLAHWINHFIKDHEKVVIDYMIKEMTNIDDEAAKRIFRYFFREYFVLVDDFVFSIEKLRKKYKNVLSKQDIAFLEKIASIDE